MCEKVPIKTFHGGTVRLRRCDCGSANLQCFGEALAGLVECMDCGRSAFSVQGRGAPSAVEMWNRGDVTPQTQEADDAS